MRPEYEGIDFSKLFNDDWEITSYNISDDGLTGAFLLKQVGLHRDDHIAIAKKTASRASLGRYPITDAGYWTASSSFILPRSMFNELFDDPSSPDSSGLGQIITKFTVGGGNP